MRRKVEALGEWGANWTRRRSEEEDRRRNVGLGEAFLACVVILER